ncbi:MAG TPA: type II secretion system protein [Sedimentisphaerales bacterium]|nr:type II secretion system protein [Sedimentisphaerales bacterium]
MKKGFTIIELVVAVGILAIVASFAGAIFEIGADSYRVAAANAEIMQKLRAITDQLTADFKGLRKDGEIFVVWQSEPVKKKNLIDADAYQADGRGKQYIRFDRIMFFANGDFQTYHQMPKDVRGNVARISYMLALRRAETEGAEPTPVERQKREQRVLARTQHILTADPELGWTDPADFKDIKEWDAWHNLYEYDKYTLQGWKNLPYIISWDPAQPVLGLKAYMLSIICNVIIGKSTARGTVVDPPNPKYAHLILCEGVGEFSIQGWYDKEKRWVPERYPYGKGDLGDFIPDPYVPGVFYPFPPNGLVWLGGSFAGHQFCELLNEEHFNEIPGLGRALKFTFTLYDSKGVIKKGRTFTHIVYLDK